MLVRDDVTSAQPALAVAAGRRLTLRNMILENIRESRLVLQDPTSKLILDNCTVVFDGSYSFSQGALEIRNKVLFDGDFTVTMSLHNVFISDGAILHKRKGALHLSPTVQFAGPLGGIHHMVRFGDSASTFKLEDATLTVSNNSGTVFTRGQLVVDGSSIVDNASTDTGRALFLGTGVSNTVLTGGKNQGDCVLKVNAGAKLTVKNAGIVSRNRGVGSLDFASGKGELVVASGGTFLFENNDALDGNSSTIALSGEALVSKAREGEISAAAIASTLSGVNLAVSVFDLSWSPDGQLIISGAEVHASAELTVFNFDGETLSARSPATEVEFGKRVCGVDIHPSGKYVAVIAGEGTGDELFVLNFTGFAFTTVSSLELGSSGSIFPKIRWSPDGQFLATAFPHASLSDLRVYRFDGSTLTQVGDGIELGDGPLGLNWSPSGNYIAVSALGAAADESLVFRFDGKALKKIFGENRGGVNGRIASWSPDEQYVIFSRNAAGGNELDIYRFDASSETLTSVVGLDDGFFYESGAWSPDGRHFATATVAGVNQGLRLYRFDGSSITQLAAHSDTSVETNACYWSPDGKHIATGSFVTASRDELNIYRVPYLGSNARTLLQNTTLLLKQDVTLSDVEIQVR